MYLKPKSGSFASSKSAESAKIQEIIDIEITKAKSAEKLFSKRFIHDYQDWDRLMKTFQIYEGKDLIAMASHIAELSDSYIERHTKVLTWELSTTKLEDTIIYFTNRDSMYQDMNLLVTVFLIRNGHITEIIKKVKGDFKNVLRMLRKKYNIKDIDNDLEPDIITMPKLAIAYPGTFIRMYNLRAMKEIVPYESLPGNIKPKTHAICCPLLQASCPFILKASDNNNLHPVMLWVMIKLYDILDKKNRENTTLMEILSYYRASYRCKAMIEFVRTMLFFDIGIIDKIKTSSGDKWKLSNSTLKLSQNCLADLNNLRRDDRDHALLMKLAKSGDF